MRPTRSPSGKQEAPSKSSGAVSPRGTGFHVMHDM
jgi:hypothetical protein